MGALAILLVLAALQGLTEYLPVSSSAHLVFGFEYLPGAEVFAGHHEELVVLLHLGTLCAVLLFYRERLLAIAGGVLGLRADAAAQRGLALKLALATAPATLVALAFEGWFEAQFEKPVPCAVALLGTGALLSLSAFVPRRQGSLESLGLPGAFAIGCLQAAAIMPGMSRSGSTIVGGLLVGLTMENATHFSFLMSIPAILGAIVFDFAAAARYAAANGLGLSLAAAMAASFAVGYASLGFLLWVARQRKLAWFAPYCWLLGAAVLAQQLGRPQAAP